MPALNRRVAAQSLRYVVNRLPLGAIVLHKEYNNRDEPKTLHGIVFVIGASGAGKTAAVQELASRHMEHVKVRHFDSVGVPSETEMIAHFGSVDAWQENATRAWMNRIVQERPKHKITVLEGQTRPSYVMAWGPADGVKVRVVLLHCSAKTRDRRLTGSRNQPELLSSRMEAWASYLREQALSRSIPIAETDEMPIEVVADAIQLEIARMDADLNLGSEPRTQESLRDNGA